MMFVAIDTSEYDSLAIDFDQAVFHLDLTEADTLSDILLGAKRDDEVV